MGFHLWIAVGVTANHYGKQKYRKYNSNDIFDPSHFAKVLMLVMYNVLFGLRIINIALLLLIEVF